MSKINKNTCQCFFMPVTTAVLFPLDMVAIQTWAVWTQHVVRCQRFYHSMTRFVASAHPESRSVASATNSAHSMPSRSVHTNNRQKPRAL